MMRNWFRRRWSNRNCPDNESCKIMFCRVYGIRGRVWGSHRTSRSSGYGHGSHRSSGYCGTGVQNSQTFRAGTRNAVPVPRVLWHGTYRSRRSSWYEYESLTELTEVPGVLTRAYRTHRSPGRHNKVVPVLRVLWPRASRIYRRSRYGYEWHTERTEVLRRIIPG